MSSSLRRALALTALLFPLAAGACSQSMKLVRSSVDPAFVEGSVKSVFAVGVSESPIIRKEYENTVVAALQSSKMKVFGKIFRYRTKARATITAGAQRTSGCGGEDACCGFGFLAAFIGIVLRGPDPFDILCARATHAGRKHSVSGPGSRRRSSRAPR